MKTKLFALILFALINFKAFSQLRINEIMAANTSYLMDKEYFNFSDWVEIYNSSSSAVNLYNFFLSDDKSLPAKWRLPYVIFNPYSYILVYCDKLNTGMHTNFKLDPTGETLYLFDSSRQIVDSISFPNQFQNISYGRKTDNSWGYFKSPTPGKTNTTPAYSDLRSVKPSFNLAPGRYNSLISLNLTASVSSVIRYTTDGSDPTENSPIYTGSIVFTSTKVIKAAAYEADKLPSEIVAGTYFFNEHQFTLPVISLTTKPDFLWNDSIGIHVVGVNGVEGNCVGKANFNRDWDRPAHIEYFDAKGSKFMDFGVKLTIGGACSRSGHPQKSFNLDFSDKYGLKALEYPLFKSKKLDQIKSLMLRNSGNDFNRTMMHDAMMQTLLIGKMNIDYLAYQPSTVYLNGAYWGIMNIRERSDADYVKANYKLDDDEFTMLQYNDWGDPVINGSIVEFTYFMNNLRYMDMKTPAAYQYIDKAMDLKEYINYLVAEIYVSNTDWPGNNQKYWKPNKVGGKWRWVLMDTDFGFGMYGSSSQYTTLHFATATDGPAWPNPPNSTLLIRKCLENPTFKAQFIQAFLTNIQTTFKPERVVKIIDSLQNTIKTEMIYHKNLWDGTISDFNYEVETQRNWGRERYAFMPEYIRSFFGLSNPKKLSVRNLTPQSGYVVVNQVYIQDTLVSIPTYAGLPYNLIARPNPGYQFSHWTVNVADTSLESLISEKSSWKYFDQGTNPGINWQSASFSDVDWKSGTAQFGYGEGDEATVVSYGSDANNKFITTYFRKQINIADKTKVKSLSLNLLYDDGAVIYVNGQEALRVNMPSGVISNSTLAFNYAATENVFYPFTIDPALLTNGVNQIAVEIHQNVSSSSDVSFDLSLSGLLINPKSPVEIHNFQLSDTIRNNSTIEAHFEKLNSIKGLKINEVSASNSLYADEFADFGDWVELYNSGIDTVDIGGLYFTDNFNNKCKFRVSTDYPQLTRIAPKGFQVLWADEKTWKGPLHLDMKLEASGERFAIYQVCDQDTNVVDSLSFGNQIQNKSLGRFPDGENGWHSLSKLTPKTSNSLIISNVPNTEISNFSIYPNPSDGNVYIRFSQMELPVLCTVFNSSGKCVYSLKINNLEDKIDLSNFPVGLYLVRCLSGIQQKVQKILIQR